MMERYLVQQIAPAVVKTFLGEVMTDFTGRGLGDKSVHRDPTGGAVKASSSDSIPAKMPLNRPPFVEPEILRRYLIDDGEAAASERDDIAVVLCRIFEFYLKHFLLTTVKKCVTTRVAGRQRAWQNGVTQK